MYLHMARPFFWSIYVYKPFTKFSLHDTFVSGQVTHVDHGRQSNACQILGIVGLQGSIKVTLHVA